jgi:uncharacterized protein YbaR (Trm112 family)
VLSSSLANIDQQAQVMSQPLDPDILTMIRCPVTHSDLVLADQKTVAELNEKISKRELVNRIGQTVAEKFDSGLVNQDASLLLPIRNGIVVLIADQAIPLSK